MRRVENGCFFSSRTVKDKLLSLSLEVMNYLIAAVIVTGFLGLALSVLVDWFERAAIKAGFEKRLAPKPLKNFECGEVSIGSFANSNQMLMNFHAEGIGFQDTCSLYEIFICPQDVRLDLTGRKPCIKTLAGKTLGIPPELFPEVTSHLKLRG